MSAESFTRENVLVVAGDARTFDLYQKYIRNVYKARVSLTYVNAFTTLWGVHPETTEIHFLPGWQERSYRYMAPIVDEVEHLRALGARIFVIGDHYMAELVTSPR